MIPGVLVAFLVAMLSSHPAWAVCAGDCGADGEVTVDEIVLGVNLALGNGSLSQCALFDRDGSGEVTVDEVIAAVNNALQGCAAATPAATPTATATPLPTQAGGDGPQLPEPRPTPVDGCGGGFAVAESSAASADNNSYVGFASPVNLTKAQAALATITPSLFSLGGSFVTCPSALGQTVRLFTFTIGGVTLEPTVGAQYQLRPGLNLTGSPTIAQVDYLEQIPTSPFGGRGWRAQSGTLTVEAIDATSMRVRISAEMAAEKNVFPVGSVAPVGSFHLEAVVAFDALARR